MAIAFGRSVVKKVSTCGPFGMSMHSVSRLPTPAGVGRIITSTVGGSCPASMPLSAVSGYFSRLISFSGMPG